MRKVLKAMVLMLVLAVPVWAGNIGCPVAPPGDIGQPFAQPSSSEPTKTGDMGQPRVISDVLMSLLQGVLALI